MPMPSPGNCSPSPAPRPKRSWLCTYPVSPCNARRGNKLRLGHLSGNRFAIKIREVNPTDVIKLKPVLDVIQRRGMPNFFGEQRFGRRNNNDQLGAALVRGDNEAVLKLLLGSPDPELDDGRTTEARRAF